MSKILQFKAKDKQGKVRNTGCMEIKNQTSTSAELYLYGDIISESMSEYYKEYYPDDKCPKDIKDFLDDIGDVDNIDIHINSGGGSVFGGIAIYNLLKNHKAYKTVYIDGIAASIASVIAMVADKLVAANNSTLMVHKPLLSYFFTTMNADDLRKDAETLDNCQKAIMNTYMSKVKDGVTKETIEALVNEETWLVGSEIANYFDIEVEDGIEAAACESEYFEKYLNIPKDLKEIPQKAADTEQSMKDTEKQNEAIKNQLLEDLDLYGF